MLDGLPHLPSHLRNKHFRQAVEALRRLTVRVEKPIGLRQPTLSLDLLKFGSATLTLGPKIALSFSRGSFTIKASECWSHCANTNTFTSVGKMERGSRTGNK
jgi:hypothetical protein